MLADEVYTFNIVNFQKVNSQFNHGMQPVLFSVKNYTLNGVGTMFLNKQNGIVIKYLHYRMAKSR